MRPQRHIGAKGKISSHLSLRRGTIVRATKEVGARFLNPNILANMYDMRKEGVLVFVCWQWRFRLLVELSNKFVFSDTFAVSALAHA